MKLARKVADGVLVMQGAGAPEVTQEDLIELRLLLRERYEANKKYVQKREEIKAKLLAGGGVEGGCTTAEVVERRGHKRVVVR
jgi:hypothetical protein